MLSGNQRSRLSIWAWGVHLAEQTGKGPVTRGTGPVFPWEANCRLHGNYTAKGQAEWMVEADRPRDPRAISLGFDSWLVRALTKYSIFIFALHSLPLTGMVIENSGMKVRGHLSVGPLILRAQTSSSWKQGQRAQSANRWCVNKNHRGHASLCYLSGVSAGAVWAAWDSPAPHPTPLSLPFELFPVVFSLMKGYRARDKLIQIILPLLVGRLAKS